MRQEEIAIHEALCTFQNYGVHVLGRDNLRILRRLTIGRKLPTYVVTANVRATEDWVRFVQAAFKRAELEVPTIYVAEQGALETTLTFGPLSLAVPLLAIVEAVPAYPDVINDMACVAKHESLRAMTAAVRQWTALLPQPRGSEQ